MVDKRRVEAVRIVMKMPPELLKRIEDYRFKRRLLSRAAAIRALVELGLRHHARSSSASKDAPPA